MKIAAEWGSGRALVAYPRSRALFAIPIIFLPFGGIVSLLVPVAIIAAGDTRTVVAVGIVALAEMVALYLSVTLLLIDAWRTSLVATTHGIELRQFPLRTRRVRWDQVHRVEAQQSGYRSGASALILTTGERIVALATDPRRAVYNGFRPRDFIGPAGQTLSPTTAELIRQHRMWLMNLY